MGFLDTFRASDRRLLEDVADRVTLARGQYLLRRGEPGGDVYVVSSGVLEVVDSRQTPEVIITTLPEGSVVGELAFVDDSPRSADVRANSDTQVLRWSREDLRILLARHVELSSAFFSSVSRLAAERIRALTEGAVSGAFLRGATEPEGSGDIASWTTRIAADLKQALPSIDADLRRDPDDPAALAGAEAALSRLERDVDTLFAATRDPAVAAFAAAALSREVHPYLTRSSLAEHAVHRPTGLIGTADLLSHVLRNAASGEARLGEVLDRWLLDRPTFQAIRAIDASLPTVLARVLAGDRANRVLFLTAGSTAMVIRLAAALPRATLLTLVDANREALAAARGAAAAIASGPMLATIQESVVALALGRAKTTVPDDQDAIVLPFLLENLPERVAVALLVFAREHLRPGGVVVLGTLGPSRDRHLVDRLLGWPTIRRNRQALIALIAAASLEHQPGTPLGAPAELCIGLRRLAGSAQAD